MSAKTLLILLIVLLALYAATVGVGFRRPAVATTGDSPAWLEALGSRLVQRQGLQADEISAAILTECKAALQRNLLLLEQGAMCNFIIKESSAPLRTLRLELASGATVQVRFEPFDAQHMTAKKTLQGDRKRMDVQVFEEGGQLNVTCLFGACQIETR